jgi:predicted HAD superfamily Cof-like phosphohydrolase
MKKQLKQTKEFNKTFGHITGDEDLSFPPEKIQKLQEKLIAEELEEFKQAQKNEDLVEVADSLVDLIYVVMGAAHHYGMSELLEECFDEIHESNMSKADENGEPVIKDDGKVLKGDGYFEPDLTSIIEKYKAS